MNLIDRTIGYFSPEKGAKRAKERMTMEALTGIGYGNHGASRKKKSMIGWLARAGSVIEDVEYNIPTLRERSRDLYMGAPLATGALKTIRTNVIGAGLKPNPQIDYEFLGMTAEEAREWQMRVEREFSLWADGVHCDAQRMNNFYELQQLAFLSWLVSGDTFALLPYMERPNMPYDIRVQLIEADRVTNPGMEPVLTKDHKIVNGVEVNASGEVIAYHFAQEHPNSKKIAKNEYRRIRKFGTQTGRVNVIHLMESERPEQRRGVPILAPVIESLKQLSRYTDAELMAAVVSGMYTVFIKSENKDEDAVGQMIDPDEEVDYEDGQSLEMGNGSIVQLGEGEDIEVANPGRPNQAFDGFVTALSRQIGSAIEVPYELLMKHFTSSYSASRAALLEAWKMFKMRRSWMASDFCQPIYEEWLSEGVAKGRIDAPGFFEDPLIKKAYTSVDWIGPSQGQLDPLKEVNAASKRIEEGLSTRARETVELGNGDYMRNHNQRVREEQLRKDGGLSSDIENEPIEEKEDD